MGNAILRLVEESMTDRKPDAWLLPKYEEDGSWDGESFWLKGVTKAGAERLQQIMSGENPSENLYSEEARDLAKHGKLVPVYYTGVSERKPWASIYMQLEFDFEEKV